MPRAYESCLACHRRSEVQEFGVRFLNSEWGFWIRSEIFWIRSADVFEFRVRFWNLEWDSRFRSEVFEFGVRFKNSEYGLSCTCGPPYICYINIFTNSVVCLSFSFSFSMLAHLMIKHNVTLNPKLCWAVISELLFYYGVIMPRKKLTFLPTPPLPGSHLLRHETNIIFVILLVTHKWTEITTDELSNKPVAEQPSVVRTASSS